MKDQIMMNEFVELINQYVPDVKCIVEIGSLNGKDSLYFKKWFPQANVYAVEGLPDNYNNYMKDLQNITPINAIITNKNKDKIIYHKKNTNGIHGIYDRGQQYGESTLELPCYTFKTISEKYKIPPVDVVKIDVEGATLDVLEGMDLSNIKIMHIETENYPLFKDQRLHDDVVKYLEDRDFKMIKLSQVDIEGHYQHDSVWLNDKC